MNHNPIKLNDPTGHKCVGDDDGCIPGEGGTGPTKPINRSETKPDKKDEAGAQLQWCLEHRYAPSCAVPEEPSIHALPIEYDFVAPWEFDKLDAWGFRFNVTFCRVLCLFDVNFDLVGNSMLKEGTLFVTPSGPSGALGWGQDSSIGLMAAYDAPDMESLQGAGTTTGGNFTVGLGAQGSYGVSAAPNVTGNYAQTWSLALSTGMEGSVGRSAGYSFPIFTLDDKNIYKGLK